MAICGSPPLDLPPGMFERVYGYGGRTGDESVSVQSVNDLVHPDMPGLRHPKLARADLVEIDDNHAHMLLLAFDRPAFSSH